MEETAAVVRLERDFRSERAARRLRTVAAVLAGLAGLWLLALPFAVPRAFGLAGLVFAALWIAGALRDRRRKGSAAEHYLELAADGLHLREGERAERLAWSEVESIWVDEDRLLVRIRRLTGSTLDLEPRYRGVGLHALAQAVKDAHARAISGST